MKQKLYLEDNEFEALLSKLSDKFDVDMREHIQSEQFRKLFQADRCCCTLEELHKHSQRKLKNQQKINHIDSCEVCSDFVARICNLDSELRPKRRKGIVND